MILLDANILYALAEAETGSRRLRGVIAARSPILVSDWTIAETVGAIGQQLRERKLTREVAEGLLAEIDSWLGGLRREGVEAQDIRRAEALLRPMSINLRAADALYIAIAERLGAALATRDGKLAAAVEVLGIEVVRP